MLDTDRRRLLEALLRKIERACHSTAAGDEDSISAFVARFFHRLLSAISIDSRWGSRATTPRGSDIQTSIQVEQQQRQPDLDVFGNFDTLFNDQVGIDGLGLTVRRD